MVYLVLLLNHSLRKTSTPYLGYNSTPQVNLVNNKHSNDKNHSELLSKNAIPVALKWGESCEKKQFMVPINSDA